MKAQKVNVVKFQCSCCGRLFLNQREADRCCSDGKCETCGAVIPHKWFRKECNKCMNKRVLAEYEASKVHLADYHGSLWYQGQVFDSWRMLVCECDLDAFPEKGVYAVRDDTEDVDFLTPIVP